MGQGTGANSLDIYANEVVAEFWTAHFDNGMARDMFFARIGEVIKVARYLVTAEGDQMSIEF